MVSLLFCNENILIFCRNVYWRAQEIPARFMRHQTPSLNVMKNLREPVKREDIVQSWVNVVPILCWVVVD